MSFVTFNLDLPPNLPPLTQALSNFPSQFQKAVKIALNRTLRSGRKVASQKIAQRYTVKAGTVMSAVKIKSNGFSASMTASGSKLPVELFKIKPRQRLHPQPRQGVFVQLVRNKGGYLPTAFLRNDGTVYQRKGKPRFPIRHVKGISAPGMLSVPPVSEFIVAQIQQRLGIELEHAADAAFGGFIK